MPSLKLSNLFRGSPLTPTLRERAASLRAHISPRVAEPRTIVTSAPTEAPTPSDPAPEADAELLRLGRQFKAASACETAANEACNAAQREAERHMPERPACLIYRASDASLGVHQERMMAEALAGREIGWSDINWLQHRMPMHHEVLRPIRKGERAHIDHPGRKFDIVPHPEAQARAEEIVAAWDAWMAKTMAVHSEYVTEALDNAANEAGDVVASLAYQIADLPAHTAAGFRVKLRALSHYSRKVLSSEITDEPDPDQLLSHSLWRDVQGEIPAPRPADTLTAAILDLWRDWAVKENAEEYDEALQGRRFALIDAAEALPATMENVTPKALALAWLEYVDHWRPKSVRGSYTTDGRLALDIHAAAAARPPAAAPAVPAAPREPNLVGMLDLASASLDDLQSLHDIADLVGGVAYATVWTARCKARGLGDEPNAAGKLMQWLGDALTDVETAANNEARRRAPLLNSDRETRLEMLALPIIQNGDPDETEAFARELLAHVKAERQGR